MRIWILAAVILGAASGGPVRAEAFARVEGTDVGPPMESVNFVLRDRAGFLWIASRDGLALYDGYSAIVFRHDLANPASIADNSIRTVYEDSKGAIWIGTNTGGLEKLDRESWTFTHHRHDSGNRDSLPHDSVFAIVEDRDGRLWVGTQGGLARLDPATGRFERFPAGAAGPASDYVVALLLEPGGALWIGTVGGGLSRRDPASGRFETFRHDDADPGSLAGDAAYAMAWDDEARLWVATHAGACRMERGGDRFDTLPFETPSGAAPSFVTGIAVDREGVVWAATLQHGLWRLASTAPRETFRRHAFRTAGSSDSRARVVFLSADREGHLWLGTWSEGVGTVSPRSRVLSMDPDPSPPQEISSLLVDRAGRLWIGLLVPRIEVRSARSAPRSFAIPFIPLRIVEADDAIWVGCSDGLLRVDPRTGALRKVLHDPNDPASLGHGWVWAIHHDRRGRLWVGTGEGGLQRMREDGGFVRFTHDPDDPTSISDDYVTAIGETPDGRLWVGTRSGGLNEFDPDTGRFSRFLPDAKNERSIGHHSVSAILAGRAGGLWVGTSGGGLNLVRRDSKGDVVEFERITEREGLVSNDVVSLIEDADGTLWIGTRRGISRYDPGSRRFVNYGTGDGLASVELAAGAATASSDFSYFGTHRGIAVVKRGTPFPELRPSPTVVTAVRTVGRSGSIERPAPAETDLQVPWGEVVSFEFAVLDFGDRRRHRYAYRISKGPEDWIDLGARREITFTDLEPGRYELFVKGRNDQGIWSEIERPLRIEVVPPIWMTAWFRFLAAALVVAAALAGHQVRLSRLARRNRELEELKNQREQALLEARRSGEALHAAYDRLRRLTRRLEAAKEDERKHMARELHDEMGQALTTAKLNLQLLAGAASPEERDRRVDDALALLDRLIGHVRALSLDLRPPLLDELGLAAALRGYLEALSKRSGLTLDFKVDALPSGIPTDVEIAAFRVVQESLTNVLRHAAASRAEVEVRYDSGALALRISDDGRGFDVGAVLDRATGGEHVGILGMMERVESMGGSMEVVSRPGNGTEIRARLPVGS